MTKINSLDDIVKNGLCIGCGLCKSIAGNSIEMEMSDKGNLEPKEITPITNETLEEIKKVCPGVIAEGPEDHKENEGANKDLVWGNYFDLYYSWSTDPKIRFQSSTGGLLNGLSLYLLEQKKVDFIMHTAGDKDNPMRNIVKYSYNKEDLINCESRSRYGPSSPLSEFHKALDKKQTFAFVGKPCDAGAIKLLAKSDKRVDQYCKYIFTLVCGGFQELTKSQEFIDSFNVKEQELEEFRYRGFGNPGRMYIKTKDQREFDKDYNSFWGDESNWKVPFRCKICPDAIGESSDIAALDTWRGGSPKGEDEGFNAAVMRTKKGIQVFNEAVESGYLIKGDKITIEDIKDFQPHQTSKKQAVFARHLGMKKNNVPTIKTKNLRIEYLYKLNDEDFNNQQKQGVSQRLKRK